MQEAESDNRKTFANEAIIPQIKTLLDQGHSVTLRLYGYSMRPFLENGRDKAVLKKCKTVRKNDIVLAEVQHNRYALHRVVRISGQEITLRGDGNIATESCTMTNVYGTALCFYRKDSKKPCCTSSLKWRIYSTVWCMLLPIRRYLLFAYRLCNNMHKENEQV